MRRFNQRSSNDIKVSRESLPRTKDGEIQDIKYRRKSFAKDDAPRIKQVSYEHKKLTGGNVVHVGSHRNWVYYFGYSYRPIMEVINEAREAGLYESDMRIVNDIKEELVDIDKELNTLASLVKNTMKKIDKTSGKEMDELMDANRDNKVKILKLESRKKALKKKLHKVVTINDDTILKELYSNSPLGHDITSKGIIKGVKKPDKGLVKMDETFTAYESFDKVTFEIFEKMYNKYEYEDTFFHFHGKYGKELFHKIRKDKKHPLYSRCIYMESQEYNDNIVPTLFGRTPIRLRKYQGTSYYKYIYDTKFFSPPLPYMFKIKYSHVLIKPDVSIDEDGYYSLYLLDYKENDFDESSKEPDSVYEEELESSKEEARYLAKRHEYVGAVSKGIQMCKIGFKNPPAWLRRLLEGVSKFDSRDFLMCRAEEFTDQWNLILMEHFDNNDYDISQEHSPFIGSPGLYTLTGDAVFRTFKPRWLTLMINDFLLGHDNGDVYELDSLFLEEGLIPNTKQRSHRGFIDEREISFPISTPFGSILIQEKVNFPPQSLWTTLKDKLKSVTFNVGKQPQNDRIYSSTTLTTEEYKIRWHSLFDNIRQPNSNLNNYDDVLVKGVTISTHPKKLKDQLRSSSQEIRVSNFAETSIRSGVDIKEIKDSKIPNHLNSEFYYGRPSSVDFNMVKIDANALENAKYINNEYGKAIETNRYKGTINREDTYNVLEPYSIGGDGDRMMYMARGNHSMNSAIGGYTKTKTDANKYNDGDIEIQYKKILGI